ncbi:MAG: 16S rRNA (adenine(1518)-N(6)/adenine(1519)-N(6))-dimethyltransferase RsmA [Holophaga sp.]|nr:16S rRNA (adenine(1518)-N(6)/adenine(1519)-N(6))-dimethyltransferase RsmA [Holophaga sp.]
MNLEKVLTPKKNFGQNFLVQQSAISAILQQSLASPAPALLEIGPGPGTLTEGLLGDGRPLWAVDLDPEAIAFLADRFRTCGHFHLFHGDAVQVALPEGGPWSVVGNLPYNAATPILTRFLLEPIPWERMVLMFQLEVGQKILGKPGTKEFGPLSVLAQLCCRVTRLMKLGPGAFRPSPKVDSVVLRFDPRPDAPSFETRRELLILLHRSFAHRRKTLSNNWQGLVDGERTAEILESLNLPGQVRAEAVPVEAWMELLGRLRKSVG